MNRKKLLLILICIQIGSSANAQYQTTSNEFTLISFLQVTIRTRACYIGLLGSTRDLSWKQNVDSLVIEKPNTIPNEIAGVFKITM